MTIPADLDSIIFMKVGRHAGETFEEILERKRQEYADAGMIFWGYGGGTMHPIMRVQPFVRMRVEHGHRVSIVMQEMNSNHPATTVFAKEFSRDGIHWEPIPDGVRVRGSRYALVLDELKEGDITEINLGEYQVGTGPSEGRLAADYIRGRVDKGVLIRNDQLATADDSKIIPVRYGATLKEPFAVLLRS
jgi:hypothetical protein